jgi:hypothetical protein
MSAFGGKAGILRPPQGESPRHLRLEQKLVDDVEQASNDVTTLSLMLSQAAHAKFVPCLP